MILLELLGTKIEDLKVEADTDHDYVVKAQIGGRTVEFNAGMWKMPETGQPIEVWDIEFSEEVEHEQGGKVREYGLTGKGKEFTVFAFVRQCIDHLIQKHHPKIIKFTADKRSGRSRASVYETFIKKYFKGYNLRKMDDGSRQVKFTMERKHEVS